MVWFQCEDCGENLKKPKLPNHFRICSSYKLSCIDCGETFTQQSVQGHTQCISEAEKYGPKDQAKSARDAHPKVNKPKPALDIDVNVGLSTRPPWFCSLCNTTTTSRQTLLLHADGKKHRAKAKAFHAAQKQASTPEESVPNKEHPSGAHSAESIETKNIKTADEIRGTSTRSVTSATIAVEEDLLKKKGKIDSSKDTETGNQVVDNSNATDMMDREVIQSNEGEESNKKRKKCADSMFQIRDHADANGHSDRAYDQKIKWKKLIVSVFESSSDGALKVRTLQKLVIKALQDSGTTKEKEQLKKKLMDKINSSSRFTIDGKFIRLAKKAKS